MQMLYRMDVDARLTLSLIHIYSYRSYIRLAKGHEAKELKPYVNKMREDHFPLKAMKNMGIEPVSYTHLAECLYCFERAAAGRNQVFYYHNLSLRVEDVYKRQVIECAEEV